MRSVIFSLVVAVLVFCFVSTVGFAQNVDIGVPPFSTFQNFGPDSINLGNLDIRVSIPIVSKRGIGLHFDASLAIDGDVMRPAPNNTGYAVAFSYHEVFPAPPYASVFQQSYVCGGGTTLQSGVNGIIDANGTYHATPVVYLCAGDQSPALSTTDGSGLTVVYNAPPNGGYPQATTTYPDGTIGGGGLLTDSNGNTIKSVIVSPGVLGIVDTVGITELTYVPENPIFTTSSYYTYPTAGGSATVTPHFSSHNIKTVYGCPGISEQGGTTNLLDSISLPDGSSYSFTYEQTPGYPGYTTTRLASITLPTGGGISYAYTGPNNGINCNDGTPAGLTRTTSDGTWTYTRNTSTWLTTTVTSPAPDSNQTVYTFSQANGHFFDTEKKVYQGAATLLADIVSCYNGNQTNCPTASAPSGSITQTDVYTTLGSMTQSSRVTRNYDSSENVTDVKRYDFGSGTATSETQTIYGTWNGSSCVAIGNSINNRACTITVLDGNLVQQSLTRMAYDAHGNQTDLWKWVSGSTYLHRTATYNANGTVATSTDVNGAQTTYTYGACNNSYPTLVNQPLSLSKSMTWDCNGSLVTSVTDENSQKTSYSYTNDPFWRVTSITDPLNNITTFSYTPTTAESTLTFNGGSSTEDILETVDAFGRTKTRQTRQAPGSSLFDTVSYSYDLNGRLATVSAPCVSTAGTTCTGGGTSTTYDPLDRPTSVTDAGGGTTAYTYSQNDVLTTISPAPSGENTKRRQLEYDALGRLTSVCEITSGTTAWPGASCGQNTSATGYLTKYTFDALGNLLTVTQNAQSSSHQQTRSYRYDGLTRLTSETNPESGTTTYVYDSVTNDPACGTVSYPGSLVKKSDPQFWQCLSYDAPRRVTSVSSSSDYGLNATFVYDSATVNGQAMQNAKGHLAEAHELNGSDLGFSYTARGEVSDVYESTANSGGYYHVSQTYWPNGALDNLSSNISSLPVFSYGVDGEGRMNKVSASTGQNPVTAVSYNSASLPTHVTFGSGDSDIFAYDSNTLRMNQFQFTIGSKKAKSLTGALTWNANSTLGNLVITDQFNSADSQTCNYSYDDLIRIASANCGTAASQTFSYDPFGNISKSGSPYSFQPTYDTATNRFATVPGGTPSYLANGNVLSDGTHTYNNYDADGNPHVVDNVFQRFDSLDRPVEQSINCAPTCAYTQIVYSPSGAKLALMNGQTLKKAFIALPGQATAVYTTGGLDHYRHSDWLGSARLTSTPSRTVSSTVAYAPFGDTYAQSGTADLSFTGMNQDTTSGDYDFPARYYSSQGRWPSPDPAGLAAVDPSNPQSSNRYSYVLNNPLVFTDPLGFCGGAGPDPDIPCPDVTSVTVSAWEGGWNAWFWFFQMQQTTAATFPDQLVPPTQTGSSGDKLAQTRARIAAYNACVNKARLISDANVVRLTIGAGSLGKYGGIFTRPGSGLMVMGGYMISTAAFPSPDAVVDWPARLALGGTGAVVFAIGVTANEIDLNRKLKKEDQRLAKQIDACAQVLQ